LIFSPFNLGALIEFIFVSLLDRFTLKHFVPILCYLLDLLETVEAPSEGFSVEFNWFVDLCEPREVIQVILIPLFGDLQ
jgi:hypothetical protein